ncbi:glycosyltransferase [Lysobacter sp.]|uniref:glycosyltransferase n=1 Tax=Lysobacter sp. TaxID=72226 RepID=UPI002D4A76BB|nr:glycosyltransferase [Lysobacter sp.]HZX78929.1 glycosyltransferase [Lysobacter sp.]
MAQGKDSAEVMDRPRVSVLLLSYRDADYIRDAIAGAFAQTVPCEIVISNDASDDATHEIACAMVATYDGPHRVTVRRNVRNLGVAAHFNEVMPLARGEIIVMMAGDDIADPDRVAAIVRAFDESPTAMVLGSDFECIDSAGQPMAMRFRQRPERFGLDYFVECGRLIGLLGATLAFRREVFDRFGPLRGPIEDNALTLRGALLGDCLCLRQPLVRYRRHAGSVSSIVFAREEPKEVAFRRRYERMVAFYGGTADDLEECLKAVPELPAARRRIARQILTMYRLEAAARAALLDGPRHRWLLPILRGLGSPGMRRKSSERLLKLLVPRRWFGLHA